MAALPARAVVGSNSGDNIFNGLYINQAIGAFTYYQQGYFGTDAIIANVEAGYIWNGHETLMHLDTYLSNPDVVASSLGQFDWHATMVGQVLNGRGLYTYQDGIAANATVWSSAIATAWNAAPDEEYTGSFEITTESFVYGYTKPLLTGVNGQIANIINSSWGFEDSTGSNFETITVDALLRSSGAVGVFSAGNSGPDVGTVGSPAAGFNGISVGALTDDTGATPYATIATFSSRGPIDFFNPVTHELLHGVRTGVDIVAPGDNLTLAFYGGVTGGHVAGTDPTTGEFQGQYYIPNMGGTSFASPIVAASAALMVDAGKSFGGGEIIDPRVIKAILLTSAIKTPGWDNGQHLDPDGVIRTTQALDYAAGAGALNLDVAYHIQIGDPLGPGIRILGLNTTAGLDGLGGGMVLHRGWDFGLATSTAPVDYIFAEPIHSGDILTATLTWFAKRTFDAGTQISTDESLDNLALQIWLDLAGVPTTLIAESDAAYSTVEHLNVVLPQDGTYSLRVLWEGEVYGPGTDTEQNFGNSWNVTATPEPGSVVLVLMGAAVAGRRRRRGLRQLAAAVAGHS
jgi:hypothetical protein